MQASAIADQPLQSSHGAIERKVLPLSSYVICNVSTLLEREGESECKRECERAGKNFSRIRNLEKCGKQASGPPRHLPHATTLVRPSSNQVGVLVMRT